MVGLVSDAKFLLTWVFLQKTKVGVEGFGGNLSPNRFIGFVVGMTSYIFFLTSYFFDEHLTPKITVQLILCFLILLAPNFMEIGNIYNSMKPIYQPIDWRKHLIPNHHSWISEYMDSRRS